MLSARLIPCLDVRHGTVVKGERFGNLREIGDPGALAARYEAQGADELVLLDVVATEEERAAALAVVREVRSRISIPLVVGGGVRTAADAGALLEAGADKVAVNSAAVERPVLISTLAQRFGRQCVVVAIDAARLETQRTGSSPRWTVLVRGGSRPTGLDARSWAVEASRLGAGEILLTSWDRDGTGAGYDLELVAAIAESVRVPVIASGGARCAAHLADALRAGASAVLAASILHDEVTTVPDLRDALRSGGFPMRTPSLAESSS